MPVSNHQNRNHGSLQHVACEVCGRKLLIEELGGDGIEQVREEAERSAQTSRCKRRKQGAEYGFHLGDGPVS